MWVKQKMLLYTSSRPQYHRPITTWIKYLYVCVVCCRIIPMKGVISCAILDQLNLIFEFARFFTCILRHTWINRVVASNNSRLPSTRIAHTFLIDDEYIVYKSLIEDSSKYMCSTLNFISNCHRNIFIRSKLYVDSFLVIKKNRSDCDILVGQGVK